MGTAIATSVTGSLTASTVIVIGVDAARPSEFVALIVKVNEPGDVGEPEMAPERALSETPGGSDPLATPNVGSG